MAHCADAIGRGQREVRALAECQPVGKEQVVGQVRKEQMELYLQAG